MALRKVISKLSSFDLLLGSRKSLNTYYCLTYLLVVAGMPPELLASVESDEIACRKLLQAIILKTRALLSGNCPACIRRDT